MRSARIRGRQVAINWRADVTGSKRASRTFICDVGKGEEGNKRRYLSAKSPMSNLASGIHCTRDLIESFNTATSSHRAFKISIANGIPKSHQFPNLPEQLVLSDTLERTGDWMKDWNSIDSWLLDKTPVYILYRLDSNTLPNVERGKFVAENVSPLASTYVMILYIPDASPVRLKMLYASTKNTLAKDLGESMFGDYVYATNKEDCLLDGYRAHRESANAAAPLTDREREV
jgi:twinfilin-like protein